MKTYKGTPWVLTPQEVKRIEESIGIYRKKNGQFKKKIKKLKKKIWKKN